MTRQFFFAPVVLPLYNARQNQKFVVGAASHKVAGMAAGVRSHARRAVIVSSPIVTASRERVFFNGFTCQDGRLACAYLPAISIRGLNRLFSAFGYLWFALRQIRRDDVVVLYNYFPEYVPVAAWLRWRLGRERVILDLEDGPREDENDLRGFVNRWSLRVLQRLCSARAIVVSRELARSLHLADVCVVNGVCADVAPRDRAFGSPVLFLYGGSIEPATGLDLFADALRLFARAHRDLASQVRFVVTGFGGTAQLDALAREVADAGLRVDVMQDLGAAEYRQMLAQADVGLSLKMPGSHLVAATFPSKVVELASHGLLVLTTDVSDVGLLFDDTTAAVLRDSTPQALSATIAAIAREPQRYRCIAQAGQRAIEARCGRRQIGARLIEFLSGPAPGGNAADGNTPAARVGQSRVALAHDKPVVCVGGSRAPRRVVDPVARGLAPLRFPLANAVVGVLPATRMFGIKRALLRLLGFELAPGCRIAGGVKFYGKGRVAIGADTWIGIGSTFVVAPDAPVTIGARCDIAPKTVFHTGTHEIGDARRRAGSGYSRPIEVGEGSWVGTNCTVLGGATIGDGSIVAAGAIVMPGDYPANVLLAGCPAVVKRELQ